VDKEHLDLYNKDSKVMHLYLDFNKTLGYDRGILLKVFSNPFDIVDDYWDNNFVQIVIIKDNKQL
jgi:hypothetical protein